MPSRKSGNFPKPWRASVRDNGISVSLGVYATYEEAKAAEDEYRGMSREKWLARGYILRDLGRRRA